MIQVFVVQAGYSMHIHKHTQYSAFFTAHVFVNVGNLILYISTNRKFNCFYTICMDKSKWEQLFTLFIRV